MDTQSLDRIIERVEEELERLREARPALASRITRAENILVTHLSCRRQRVIRVRTTRGRHRYLVTGSKGEVYVVDPATWSCTCSDYHRSGLTVCKHGIACFVLERVSRHSLERVAA